MAENPGFTVPQPLSAVGLILAANVVVYLTLASGGFAAVVPAQTLFAKGALYLGALDPGERWRLLAATFLHADPAFLALDAFVLLGWGPALERRIGFVNFLAVYLVAAVASSATSVALHHSSYLAFGAAGPIFGLLGALLALWALSRARFSPTFFLSAIGFNFGLAATARHLDMFAPVGGLVGGFLACVALDLLGRFNKLWLSCKFPEMIRVWLLVLALAGAALVWLYGSDRLAIAAAGGAMLVPLVVKAVDAALAVRRGLAVVVAALAAATTLVSFALASAAASHVATTCAILPPGRDQAVALCESVLSQPLTVAAVTGALAALVGGGSFLRGLHDKGFVAASFRGERRRAVGL